MALAATENPALKRWAIFKAVLAGAGRAGNEDGQRRATEIKSNHDYQGRHKNRRRWRGSRRESAAAQLFSLGHIRAMKKFIFTFAITMLASRLPAPTILTVTALAGGNLQIVALMGPQVGQSVCVLLSTTNLASWTAVSTNTIPSSGMVTNIVQTTNSMRFYRVEVKSSR